MPEGPKNGEPSNVVSYDEFKKRLDAIRAKQDPVSEETLKRFEQLFNFLEESKGSREKMLTAMVAVEAHFENIRKDLEKLGEQPEITTLFTRLHAAADEIRTKIVTLGIEEWERVVRQSCNELIRALETRGKNTTE